VTLQELQEAKQQQAAASLRRAHNKRQRERRQQRLIDSVNSLLTGLDPPAGLHAAQQYQSLLGPQLQQQLHNSQLQSGQAATSQQLFSSSRFGTADVAEQLLAAMPARLRAAVRADKLQQLLHTQQQQQQQQQLGSGLIRLAAAPSVAAVEQQLLFDWSTLPAVVDPAFGGQLADADVVRAGRGRMNLRALRKRVQVSCVQQSLVKAVFASVQHYNINHMLGAAANAKCG
jgi:hypothetical protein